MSKPLYARTPGTRLRGAQRDIDVLKRRSCGPKQYPGVGDAGAYYPSWADVSSRRKTWYRFKLGGGVEWAVNATGGTPGTPILPIIVGYYDPDEDLQFSVSDILGNHRTVHINGATGDLVDGPVP